MKIFSRCILVFFSILFAFLPAYSSETYNDAEIKALHGRLFSRAVQIAQLNNREINYDELSTRCQNALNKIQIGLFNSKTMEAVIKEYEANKLPAEQLERFQDAISSDDGGESLRKFQAALDNKKQPYDHINAAIIKMDDEISSFMTENEFINLAYAIPLIMANLLQEKQHRLIVSMNVKQHFKNILAIANVDTIDDFIDSIFVKMQIAVNKFIDSDTGFTIDGVCDLFEKNMQEAQRKNVFCGDVSHVLNLINERKKIVNMAKESHIEIQHEYNMNFMAFLISAYMEATHGVVINISEDNPFAPLKYISHNDVSAKNFLGIYNNVINPHYATFFNLEYPTISCFENTPLKFLNYLQIIKVINSDIDHMANEVSFFESQYDLQRLHDEVYDANRAKAELDKHRQLLNNPRYNNTITYTMRWSVDNLYDAYVMLSFISNICLSLDLELSEEMSVDLLTHLRKAGSPALPSNSDYRAHGEAPQRWLKNYDMYGRIHDTFVIMLNQAKNNFR